MGSALGKLALAAAEAVVGSDRVRGVQGKEGDGEEGEEDEEDEADEADGAVGELAVELLHATGLVTESQSLLGTSLAPNPAPSLVFELAVGDGEGSRGAEISASEAHLHTASAWTVAETYRLEVQQNFKLGVHDSLTQRLRLRVLIRETSKFGIEGEFDVLAITELPLSDLRLGTTASRAVVLPISGRHDPGLLHLTLTYRLRSGSPAPK
jgi:hypothetical protein